MGIGTIGRCVALAAVHAIGFGPALPGVEARPDLKARTNAGGYLPESVECQALQKMNAFRRKHGKGPLTLSATLGAAAEHHSADMASRNYFDHNLRGGPTWDQNIRQHGYRAFPIGENIAAGMGSAAGVVNAWKQSPEHRRGMLDGDYGAVGIGRAYDASSEYGYYWTADFGGPVDHAISCR